MKKEENTETKRNVISTEILDDKTLLVVSKKDDDIYPTVSVKYVEDTHLRETRIATLSPGTIVKHNDRMVAVLLPSGKLFKKNRIVSVYDVAKHEFTSNELLRMDYEILASKGVKVKQLTNRSK